MGPRWGCLSLDRPSRFVAAWGFGPSEDDAAPGVVGRTRQRTAGRRGVPWLSDGRGVYRWAIRRIYRDAHRTGKPGRPPLRPTPGVSLTQVIKHRRKGRVVRVEVRGVIGEAIPCPYTVHQERVNGSLRDRLACLTRKTHAFAKREETWDALVGLALFEHNWLRPHPALRERLESEASGRRYRRRTPAMAIGLTDHVWGWEEFLKHPGYQ